MFSVRVYLKVRGTVQDVGFRKFCLETALPLHITGYAENIYDGSVDVVAEGEEKDVNVFLQKINGFDIAWHDDTRRKAVESVEITKRERFIIKRKYKEFS